MANLTIIPTGIGLGTADFNGQPMGVIRLVGHEQAALGPVEIDIVMTQATLAQLVATADNLRSQLRADR